MKLVPFATSVAILGMAVGMLKLLGAQLDWVSFASGAVLVPLCVIAYGVVAEAMKDH